MLSRFDYRVARTLDEAMALHAEQPGARYFAGGTDLLPQMRTRRRVSRLVDLKRIPELAVLRSSHDGHVFIGATVPLAAIAAHPDVRSRYPLVAECCQAVGAYPLRNRATMAGNICNASPAADTAAALIAIEAEVIARGPQGERTISAQRFFAGPSKTVLEEGELVTAIVLPASAAGWHGSYLRLSRRKGMDLATLGVLVARQPAGKFAVRIALAAVAPTPLRVQQAEALLLDEGLSPTGIARAAELARLASSPISDVRGSADYRREMVQVLTARGLAALA